MARVGCDRPSASFSQSSAAIWNFARTVMSFLKINFIEMAHNFDYFHQEYFLWDKQRK